MTIQMKIVYGITKSNFGGAQRYVFDLACEAKRRGHDVAVLCGGDGVLVKKLQGEGVRIISIPDFGRDINLLKDAKGLLFILRRILQEKPDVFHINSAKMGGAGIFVGRLFGVRQIIFTAHGWAWNEPRPIWQKALIKFFSWLTVVFTHKTICVSEETRRQISGWPFIKNKLRVVYNGIDKFDLLPRQNQTFTVGTIAELHKVKGLDILLKAWSKFVRKNPAQLVIIGEGDERENLEKMAKDMGISDSVKFRGFVDNARRELASFDIFVLASRSEAMPYVPLEAGLAKLPVIATSVGGVPEIIESGITGILVPKEDPEAIFSSLVLLTEDAHLRERLGEALYKKVKEEFSQEKMFEKTFSTYEE